MRGNSGKIPIIEFNPLRVDDWKNGSGKRAIQQVAASGLLAEPGVGRSVFPTSSHCASWAGLCPGQNESAGVIKSARAKKGNGYLRQILTQSAWAISHKKEGYLRAFFHRVSASRVCTKA